MRGILLALATVVCLGCDAPTPNCDPPPIKSTDTSTPARNGPTGTLTGQVTWVGEKPRPLTIETFRPVASGRAERVSRSAPNVPAVDIQTGAVEGVLVYLQTVSGTSRAWDHPPVTLELHDERPMIRQGNGPLRNTGIVRRGDAITIVSKQDRFQSVRARGAAFWTMTLPDADRPITRRLDKPGIVELSSAGGYYWMHGYLFVSEHPYCAVTDSAGQFAISGLPPGDYNVTAWLPSWEVSRRERDPESTAVTRIFFGPHHEWRKNVSVRADEKAEVKFTVPQ
jgi:hypothetical protein